ncbi:MAG: HAMP domain-containing histidine kinase [Ignavibacteria bacterium]|nr:HAMP domain-containing histidine kinase [Ignavibacteria bacterium]
MRWYETLRGRLLVGSLLLLVVLFGIYSYISILFFTDQMMAQVLESANRVSDFIKSSTHYSMLLNRKEDVYQIINTIGKQAGIEGIRIYNKRGMITFSTVPSEKGSVVDLKAEACFGCHDQVHPLESVPIGSRTRIYTGPGGRRLLGLINPIRNEPTCTNAGCHTHPEQRTVLGVLDVRMSLERIDAGISRAQWQLVIVGLAFIVLLGLGSTAFLSYTVVRPVRRLMKGTQAISSRNLDYQISIGPEDEIGQLARSFNSMVDSLRRAEHENREWASTLEQRVKEKTEELKKIHQQILQIEKMASLGKLSATVAHELNNPLEGILTYAKLIGRRLRKLPSVSDDLQQTIDDIELVRRETERCGTIVKNLLLFSKKQVGEFVLVPVRQVVERAQQLVQHHFEISDVRFEAVLPDVEVQLLCDENQIEQALVALFVNAVEAMPDGGKLRVTVTRAGADGEMAIEVADTGIGIAAEDLDHVFEPFYSTKKNEQGVGLGLSVVYGIVERHGGQISVDSAPGKGTRFLMRFPGTGSRAQSGEYSPPNSVSRSLGQ